MLKLSENYWVKLIIFANDSDSSSISHFLLEVGAVSVSLVDGGDQPLFQEQLNETPFWLNTHIHALFEPADFSTTILDGLSLLLGKKIDYQIETVVDQDWIKNTQQNFPAQFFPPKLWITPPWQTVEQKPGEVVVKLNPGLGFGTGTHPTTHLCLEWLAQQDFSGKMVIDYGCGSGILGLSAIALGAERVVAVDHDPQALTATNNNAVLNDVIDRNKFSIILPEQMPALKADIILANILANPLLQLAPSFKKWLNPAGFLVLSGFLENELDLISKAYLPELFVVESKVVDNWLMIVLTRHNEFRGARK